MERAKRKELIVVVSDKIDKTRVVAIETWKVSPIYGKGSGQPERYRPMMKTPGIHRRQSAFARDKAFVQTQKVENSRSCREVQGQAGGDRT